MQKKVKVKVPVFVTDR